jgi:hypothetical protein
MAYKIVAALPEHLPHLPESRAPRKFFFQWRTCR